MEKYVDPNDLGLFMNVLYNRLSLINDEKKKKKILELIPYLTPDIFKTFMILEFGSNCIGTKMSPDEIEMEKFDLIQRRITIAEFLDKIF